MNIKFIEEEEKTAEQELQTDTELKTWIVNYVGDKKAHSSSDQVTVDMILEIFSAEFPEFILPIAEENWIRGYQQALTDVSVGEKLHRQESEINGSLEKDDSRTIAQNSE